MRVEFDHVTFRYPTRPERLALDDFSLDVQPGNAGLGRGCCAGKSTVLRNRCCVFDDPELERSA